MFICEIWLFDWYFPQFCTSDMSKYGYLEVFGSLRLRDNESRLYMFCEALKTVVPDLAYPVVYRAYIIVKIHV